MLYVGNTLGYPEQLAQRAAPCCDSSSCRPDERKQQLLFGLASKKSSPQQKRDGQLALTGDLDAVCLVSETSKDHGQQAARTGLRHKLKQLLLGSGTNMPGLKAPHAAAGQR
jgi:hypothetical protein